MIAPASVGLMLHGASASLFILGMALWMLVPHAPLLFASMIPKHETARALLSLLAIVVAGCGLFVYYQMMFMTSSTTGLGYLWIPVWQLLVAALAFSVAIFFRTQPPLNADRSPPPVE